MGGLDGCRGGWLLASVSLAGDLVEVRRLDAFAPALALVLNGRLGALAVDMPIGLPDGAPRVADVEARRRLGARRSSVFPTPVRAALGARDYPEALAISRQVCGKGLSKQAYHLLARMAEVDASLSPEHQDRIFECHPELAFVGLAGHGLEHSKHTAAGIEERAALLAARLGPPGAVDRALARRTPGAGPDDVVDALAIALVARAVAAGDPAIERLGDGAHDRRGLRMEIVTRSDRTSREVPCND